MPKGEAGTPVHHDTLKIQLTGFSMSPVAVLWRNLPAGGPTLTVREFHWEELFFPQWYKFLQWSLQLEMFRNGRQHLTLPSSGKQPWTEKGPMQPTHLCFCFSYTSWQRERRASRQSLKEVNKQIHSSTFQVKIEFPFSAFFLCFAMHICSSYICSCQRILLFLITLVSTKHGFSS